MMHLSLLFVTTTLLVVVISVCLLGLAHAAGRRVPTEPARSGKTTAPQLPATFSIRGLRKDYPGPTGPVTAIRNVNIDITAGMTAIVGPSGGGKTTILNCLGALDVPTRGEIWFRGSRLDFQDRDAMRQFRAHGIAWVFQQLNLITHQTVAENVALPLLCAGVKRSEALRTARRMLDRLDIGDLSERWPEKLSAGQRQRVAIARAFASDAEVVLADEPTGSLDPKLAETVMAEFRRLSEDEGKPVLLVTHNHELARRYCNRVLLCDTDGLREMPDRACADQTA